MKQVTEIPIFDLSPKLDLPQPKKPKTSAAGNDHDNFVVIRKVDLKNLRIFCQVSNLVNAQIFEKVHCGRGKMDILRGS